MDVTDINPELEKLEVDLDELEELLKPLLSISEVSSQLPLLDKAKLCVLASYSIESLLFSSLRLNGVDAKNHAVFKELVRVRQYFEKIKKIETPPEPRPTSLDTTAAIRFLKADLADNTEVKNKLAEKLAKERAIAAMKGKGDKKRPADESPASDGKAEGSKQKSDHGAKRSKHGGSKRKG